MQRLFSAFPRGLPGLGLMILRLVVAINSIVAGISVLDGTKRGNAAPLAIGVVAILFGASILVGFLTPLICGFAAIGYSASGLLWLPGNHAQLHTGSIADLNLAITSLALILVGPGAFSIDARLFGRREIMITNHKPHLS